MDPKESENLARKIKAVVFDVDGVFTDNRVFHGAPYKAKWRTYYDGQGVSLLRAVGIRIALVTNEKEAEASHIVEVVEKWNNLPSSKKPDNSQGWEHVSLFQGMGGPRKVEAAQKWLDEIGVSWEECAAMGDDLVDLQLLDKAALKAAPVSGEGAIRGICDFVSARPGGYGAVRDFANFILKCRGIDPFTLPPQ